MITSIFSKSKPINFIIVFSISLLAVLITIFKLDWVTLTGDSYLILGLAVLCCFLSILLLDFIVGKNALSLKNNYEILLFSLFLLAVPQIFFNHRIIVSNFLLLLALRKIVSLRTQKEIIKKLFDSGFLIGLATIFHFWAILFFPLIFIALLFYTETEMKSFIIPVLGLLAIIVVSISYSIVVNGDFFSALHINPEFSLNLNAYNSIQFIVAITMLLSFGLWSSIFYLKDIKKKMKTFRPSYKVVFVCCIIASIIVVISPNKNGSEFLFLFAPLSIIISNYIETIEEKWFKEIFLLALIIIPFTLLVL